MAKAEYKRWYGTSRWKKLRLLVLRRQPTCQLRLGGCDGVATQVDHIIPARDRPDLFWSEPNLQGVCQNCQVVKGASRGAVSADRPRALKLFDV